MKLVELIPIFISVISLCISGLLVSMGWWKQRNIYDIERVLFFRKTEKNNNNNNEILRNKLNTGHYTILNTNDYGGYIEIILGKIKK